MYKVYNGKDWIVFENYQQLLNFLSGFNRVCGTEVYNGFLERVGHNPNDVIRTRRWIDTWSGARSIVSIETRDHMILNEDGYSIYDKNLVKDVYNWKYSEEIHQQTMKFRREYYYETHKKVYYSDRYGSLPSSAYPDFRRGPVPYIHKRRRYSVYRLIRTTNEKRLSADPETQEFNRACRGKNLPDLWDDHLRDWRNHGWKRQGKNRHQWEGGFKTRSKHEYGKGVFVVKEKDNSEEDYTDDVA